ncbi:hypothetical protein ACHAQH_008144 [Verticillium albo-atrum]
MSSCDHDQQGRRPPTPQTSPSPTPSLQSAAGAAEELQQKSTSMPTPTALGLAALRQPRIFFPSHGFIVGAGTVTVDLKTRRVLLVFNKRQGIFQLPKGRKNVGEESLLACAVRETLEETGVRVTPLAVRCGTRATLGGEMQEVQQHVQAMQRRAQGAHVDMHAAESDDDGLVQEGLTEGFDHLEAVACCHWVDVATGAMKMVFYYAASADESVSPEALVGEDEGRFENVWCGVEEAAPRLAFETDGMVVDKAVADLRRSGFDI